MQLGSLTAHHRTPDKSKGPSVVLLHGIGLGAWMWEQTQELLVSRGLESYALELPGHVGDEHSNPSLSELIDAVDRALDEIEGPIALVGHSMGSLVAQAVAMRRELHCLVLVAPMPPHEILYIPTRDMLQSSLPTLPSFLTSDRVSIPMKTYVRCSLKLLPESERQGVYDKIVSWPKQLIRDCLLDRPSVPVDGISCPVLVAYGGSDPIGRAGTARLIGDHYNALIWRFDDLGHMPSIEPGGDRMFTKVAGWLRRPKKRRVDEIDAHAPNEGVGQELRNARRGGRRTRTKLH